jgi:hypothetical protein
LGLEPSTALNLAQVPTEQVPLVLLARSESVRADWSVDPADAKPSARIDPWSTRVVRLRDDCGAIAFARTCSPLFAWADSPERR